MIEVQVLSPEEFRKALCLVTRSDREMAHILEVSPSSVRRYKDGSVVPHPLLRRAFLNLLASPENLDG